MKKLAMRNLQFYPMWVVALVLAGLSLAAQATDFRVTDTAGKVHTLSGYKGKWVLVNYWATWCPPCLEEIPDLIALHENKKNNLVVIGIALDYRDPKQVIDFAEGLFVTYPIVLGTPEIVRQIGPMRGLPTTYLFNPDGKMVAQQVGLITKEAVEQFISGKSARAKK